MRVVKLMKRFLPALLIISLLFITSCTKSAKEYNVSQSLNSYNVVAASLNESRDIVYVTDTGKKYHEYGCRYLQFSCIAQDLQQAISKGYTPCSVCITP